MGDKVWSFSDCPNCGGKGTLEEFEHDSSWFKSDRCNKCGYYQGYTYEEKDGVIHITPDKPIKQEDKDNG